MKKGIAAAVLTLGLAAGLLGCGSSGDSGKTGNSGNYKDGTYTGRSQDHTGDESGNGAGYGEAVIEIKANKIVSCTFTMYELDGTIKGDDYGADLSKENRLKAQKAVQAGQKYSSSLVSGGSLDSVDAITGATISHAEFQEAVNDALSKASE